MSYRYAFGGDEHLFVEVDEAMSLEAFFVSLAITNTLREAAIEGVTEICPANASFQVKFDPDRIHPSRLLDIVKEIESAAAGADSRLDTRIIEIPVYYQDPWTHETLMRFRERHQDPDSTDIEYAARINGYGDVGAFVEAHSGAPWFVSMVGFVSGLPFLYQMVDRPRQIQVPKYLRPRTDTPKLTVGYGGCFSLHLFGPRRWRLPDVRHHSDADLRPGAAGQPPQGFHGLLPARATSSSGLPSTAPPTTRRLRPSPKGHSSRMCVA